MSQSLTSMVTSGMLAAPQDDSPAVKAPGPRAFSSLVSELQKMGARHGKKDRGLVQTIHDTTADLTDCACCGALGEKAIKPAPGMLPPPPTIAKANARHSGNDQQRIQAIHDLAVELGAVCKGVDPNANDAAEDDDTTADDDDGKKKDGGK